MKKNTRALQRDKYIYLIWNQTQFVLKNGGARLFVSIGIFKLYSPLNFWMGTGCSGLMFLKIPNIYGGMCNEKCFLFHPFYDIYYYPCVQYCLEPFIARNSNYCIAESNKVNLKICIRSIWPKNMYKVLIYSGYVTITDIYLQSSITQYKKQENKQGCYKYGYFHANIQIFLWKTNRGAQTNNE